MEQIRYKSQFIKSNKFHGEGSRRSRNINVSRFFARDARESAITFRANERIHAHSRGWVSLSALNAIAVHDKMLPLGNR